MATSCMIIAIVFTMIGGILGILISGNALLAEVKKQHGLSDKYLALYLLYDRWLLMKQTGRSVKEYFESHGYNRVAIYGMGKIGIRFFQELVQEGVEVLYVIDRNASQIKLNIECLSPEDNLPEVDVIIVTVIDDCERISKYIGNKTQCVIVSLEDIILKL